MTCRLPVAVHVPLNSCHSESLGAGSACVGDTAPIPATISTTRRRGDLCQPSFPRRRAAPRKLRSLTIPSRHRLNSAAERVIDHLLMSQIPDLVSRIRSLYLTSLFSPELRG